MLRWCLMMGLVLSLAACNTVAGVRYMAPANIVATGLPVISGVSAVDQRREAPTRLATIMGGYGNPLKTLDTDKPVKDVVADAFAAGLRVRGLLAAPGQAPFTINLVIRKFDADQYLNRSARVDLTLFVLDRAGQTVYQRSIADMVSELRLFQGGIAASIDELRQMAEGLLSRTVDRMLDDPEFRTVVDRAAA